MIRHKKGAKSTFDSWQLKNPISYLYFTATLFPAIKRADSLPVHALPPGRAF